MKAKLNAESGKVEISEKNKERSLVLVDEKVYTVFEYVPDKMIISLALTNILIVHNWVPQKLI